MRHEYLATRPVDLYSMHLFELVAIEGSFTRAAGIAGVSQSAVTRQIQGMENRLGVTLLERTTRKVTLTDAGHALLAEARQLNGSLEASLRRFKEEHVDATRTVRVGFSRSVGLASLPGFLLPFHRKSPEVRLKVSHEPGVSLLAALLDHRLDIAILTAPEKINPALQVQHSFADEFELIIGAQAALPPGPPPWSSATLQAWLDLQTWMHLSQQSHTGQKLAAWLKEQHYPHTPAMELDNFEILIQLVAMGLGASWVPRRALAAYPRKKALQRVPLPRRFERQIVMVTRRTHTLPKHIQDLIEGVLFS
ncbi:LysR family transcriptional regulator [Verrucomicrobium sp. BvORR034]|uniref:LysR family transcriptional regulator n=1 Tax=Verrucomicrobium sp. BvORR034 TaxID=1396418 RepID=UPI0007C6590D|nr:LysR family transcriptional regulator [Verrucomicrobium sp. BvORR034]